MKSLLLSLLPKKEIGRNALVYSLGTYSSKIISLIIFPIIAVELGFEDTGKYDLVISSVIILGPIFSLQIGDAAYRWLSESDKERNRIGFTATTLIILSMVVLVSLIVFFIHFISPTRLLLVGYTILVSQMLLNTMMQVLRGNRQVKLYTTAMITRSIVFTIGELWAVFYSENKLENVLAAFAVANLASFLVCISKGFKNEQFSIQGLKKQHFKEVLTYAYPLVFNALGWVLLININKFIIISELGYEMNGVFAVAEKLASPIFFLGIFYFFSAQDHFLARTNFHKSFVDFRELVKRVSFLTILGVIALIIAVYALLPVIFPNLEASITYLPLLTIANLLMIASVYMGIPYTYQKKSLSLAITTIAGILLTILGSFLLIKPWGIQGVSVAILSGALLTLILRVRFVKSFFQK